MIYPDKKIVWLKPEEITLMPGRRNADEKDYDMVALTESICENGIIQPPIVRRISLKGYELISGYRRLAAAKRLGMRRIPCMLCAADDKSAAFIAVNENLCRKPLSFIEESEMISELMKGFGLSEEETAVKLGMSRSALRLRLSVLKLDSVSLQRIRESDLSLTQAEYILNFPPELRRQAIDTVISENCGISRFQRFSDVNGIAKAEEYCEENHDNKPVKNELPQEEKESSPKVKKTQIGDIRLFTNSLSKLVDTMQNAGISAKTKCFETDRYIEYKVRIAKKMNSKEYTQLKIC